jgi:hypothetical protein
MAAIMYLRDERYGGVGVIHVDDINVRAEYRGQGLARRLLALADDVARRKGYRFVTLEVQAGNTPALSLYRKLGYQEQHYRYFAADAEALAAQAGRPPDAPAAGETRIRALARSRAIELSRRIFRAEREVDSPDTAPVMATYYAPRLVRRPLWSEALAHNSTDVGYWFARRDKQGIVVVLGLAPELWGGDAERGVLRVLAARAGRYKGSQLRLWLMSGAHHRALTQGSAPLAEAFGLADTSDKRMIMVKVLGPE